MIRASFRYSRALRETWERRERGQLTIAAYEAVGGIKDAIASKADEVYGSFDDQGKRVKDGYLSIWSRSTRTPRIPAAA